MKEMVARSPSGSVSLAMAIKAWAAASAVIMGLRILCFPIRRLAEATITSRPHVLGHDGLAKHHAVQNGVGRECTIAEACRLHAVLYGATVIVNNLQILIALVEVKTATLPSALDQPRLDGGLDNTSLLGLRPPGLKLTG